MECSYIDSYNVELVIFCIQVAPTEQFLLPPNGVLEMSAAVRTLSISKTTKYMVINVVDSEYHQLIRNWLVAVKTRLPTISKVCY